jgi:nucleoid DNA-binding protein
MKYQELINKVYLDTGVSKQDVKKVLDAMQHIVILEISNNNSVYFNKIGYFKPKIIKPRTLKINKDDIKTSEYKKTIGFVVRKQTKQKITDIAEAVGEFEKLKKEE